MLPSQSDTHLTLINATRQYMLFLTFSRAMSAEAPDEGAAADPVPEENGVLESADNIQEVKCSLENPSGPPNGDMELSGMIGKIILLNVFKEATTLGGRLYKSALDRSIGGQSSTCSFYAP